LEIERLYREFFKKDAVAAAVGAGQATNVDSDSEESKDKDVAEAMDSDEDDESQSGGEDRKPKAKKRRIEGVSTTPAFDAAAAAAPVTPPGLVRVVEPAEEKKKGWAAWPTGR
jgi:hypothetical protein